MVPTREEAPWESVFSPYAAGFEALMRLDDGFHREHRVHSGSQGPGLDVAGKLGEAFGRGLLLKEITFRERARPPRTMNAMLLTMRSRFIASEIIRPDGTRSLRNAGRSVPTTSRTTSNGPSAVTASRR
jgi:hypothetical protein